MNKSDVDSDLESPTIPSSHTYIREISGISHMKLETLGVSEYRPYPYSYALAASYP